MDPVTLVMAALAAGAMAGLKDTMTTGISDAYGGLKQLVIGRLENNQKALNVLADHGSDPDTYEKPLCKELEAAGVGSADTAGRDADLLTAAQQLLSRVDPAGAQVGKYNVHATDNARIGAIGDHATVTMNERPTN